jgi:hypothetical protein
MNYTTKGKIKSISEVQTFDSGAKKLSFQLVTDAQYNNLYSFEVFKNADNVKHLESFLEYNKVGNEVEIEWNVQCREYEGKHYTNLSMWKCSKVTDAPTDAETFTPDGDDDLAF